jgi:hypothetical protein
MAWYLVKQEDNSTLPIALGGWVARKASLDVVVRRNKSDLPGGIWATTV